MIKKAIYGVLSFAALAFIYYQLSIIIPNLQSEYAAAYYSQPMITYWFIITFYSIIAVICLCYLGSLLITFIIAFRKMIKDKNSPH